ncbi:peptide-methionine (S)-S-oxide reductase MsrA [Pedobacter gandavensis]|uniref:Peptide methionine sulfoxide reductase MsrA n=1 Tax=Pedobacter gandavensis TaxID=2679963 RepID=A0ABR6F1S2_9SPHI|nr:peptide-methionine (S)-S-oxide reductase MsrA [Pedobacter gandavensis]MBB2151487.1 peptide-methionine (S)-S-oxide reductase MsrA [Pedobacter gandavensis]
MKIWSFISFMAFVLLTGCYGDQKLQHLESKNGFAVLVAPAPNEQLATFAGGCFWATQEAMMELKGVHKVISGYAGGTTVNPSYQDLQSQTTGHAEAVEVYYDPSIISFETLCRAFFNAHNPTEVDRQGPDVGEEYRSIAFFRSPAEYRIISGLIHQLEKTDEKGQTIATEILPFKVFYPAEMEHQDYYQRNQGDSYIRNISRPKVMKLRAKMPEMIKPEYLK